MAENEEEISSGLLQFTVDGRSRTVPELKWRANRAWQAQMQDAFARLLDVPENTPEGQAAMADAERELVLAYDATGALGDLEDATEREIDAIYDRLIEVSFPQSSSQAAVAMMILRAVTSAQASSGSSPSLSGTSVPTPLNPRSPSARSRSSTPRRRSA